MKVISHYRQTGRTTALCQLVVEHLLSTEQPKQATICAPTQPQALYCKDVLRRLLEDAGVPDADLLIRSDVKFMWLREMRKHRGRRAATFIDNWDLLTPAEQIEVGLFFMGDIEAVTIERHARVSHFERGEDEEGPYVVMHFEPEQLRTGDAGRG